MFISEHYRNKLWTNHERESAQARAFESHQEYILPAFFDTSVKVPGLPKTIGHVSLSGKTPEDFAALIAKKLEHCGVELSALFAYADEAKADVDFPRAQGTRIGVILNDLKSHTWPKQGPAIDAIFDLDWKTVSKDEAFVLGRNIYQSACGSEWKALAVIRDLREKLAEFPQQAAAHLLNGMFFEAYFNKEGEFRGSDLKAECLDELLKVQSVKRFEPSISFIRRALQPYKEWLPFLPSTRPEIVTLACTFKLSDPPELRSLKHEGRELLTKVEDELEFSPGTLWKLALKKFTVIQLKETIAKSWGIPLNQLEINASQKMDPDTEYRLPKGFNIRWPKPTPPKK